MYTYTHKHTHTNTYAVSAAEVLLLPPHSSLQTQHEDPYLAIVVDPVRTMAAGKVEIGAFRTYPPNYKPPDAVGFTYMCVCMYVYTCACVCMYVFVCTHTQTHKHTHMHVYICICTPFPAPTDSRAHTLTLPPHCLFLSLSGGLRVPVYSVG